MATRIDLLTFTVPFQAQPVSMPAPWTPDAPEWLRKLGRVKVFVIDDQIQQLADLSDEDALRERICDPLNLEFVFCPECAPDHPLSREGKWFDSVAARLQEEKGSLAAVCLDIMFAGETDPLRGSGIQFLTRIREIDPSLPVLIMTQARDEKKLNTSLSEAGVHRDFLHKDGGSRVDALCHFLCEYGLICDPAFNAFSRSMRSGLAGLRSYAIRRPHIHRSQVGATFGSVPLNEIDLPKPILFLAPSGEGKTWTAGLAARWLMQVNPAVCKRREIEILDCNTLQRDQGAKIALFGRGAQDARLERPDASGLVVRGKAHRASDGILIIDELGNSDLNFQEMLLSFVESGRTEPEFRNDRMTNAALGPLRVLCIFTAQLRHLAEGRIKPDIERRIRRGSIINIPPLPDRLEEVVPIFYQRFKSYRQQQDPTWREPSDLDDILSAEAQDWLRHSVATSSLSASALADLVGELASNVKVIGIPYLDGRLRSRMEATPNSHAYAQPESQPPAPSSTSIDELDAWELVEKLSRMKNIRFPHDRKKDLEGYLGRVQEATSNIVLPYLEACLEIARGAKSELNVVGTYKFISGEKVKKTTAATRLKDLLLLSRASTMKALLESELLARLAIAVADRSREVEQMLEELALDQAQAERLQEFGWQNKKNLRSNTQGLKMGHEESAAPNIAPED
jgi:CheY-like chemotaxis protein